MGLFIITELDNGGVFTSPTTGVTFNTAGERFEWSSSTRDMPFAGWDSPVVVRTKRVDYPGADSPTEQVLGPNYGNQSFQGKWDDRFNQPGYAKDTLNRFEAMVRRGNPVSVEYVSSYEDDIDSRKFRGVIVEFTPKYVKPGWVDYSFTLSVHSRDGADVLDAALSPQEQKSATTWQEDVELAQAKIEEINNLAKNVPTSDAFHTSVSDSINDMATFVNKGADFLSNGIEDVDDAATVISDSSKAIRRISSNYAQVRTEAVNVLNKLVSAKSDVNLAYETAKDVLDYESWGREVSYTTRLAILGSAQASKSLDEKADPDVLALYRAQAGDSLYKIALRFYGTQNGWKAIADRNNIVVFTMEGGELLIIPQRGNRLGK